VARIPRALPRSACAIRHCHLLQGFGLVLCCGYAGVPRRAAEFLQRLFRCFGARRRLPTGSLREFGDGRLQIRLLMNDDVPPRAPHGDQRERQRNKRKSEI
jgi:hypothetical protein